MTGIKVFDHQVVRNCLSVMQSAGMYDYSGTFAYRVGFPAKSGVGGALLIVIPGVCGFTTWSPRLDEIGNSARGVQFCKLLSERFAFHMFAPHFTSREEKNVDTACIGSDFSKLTPLAIKRRQRSKTDVKADPRRPVKAKESCTAKEETMDLLWATKDGDLDTVRQIIARGCDVDGYDFDLRTALHIAACEGHGKIIAYLLRNGADPLVTDKFGGTPLSDARQSGSSDIVALLEDAPIARQHFEQGLDNGVSKQTANVYRSLLALEVSVSTGFTSDVLCDVLERAGIRRDDDRLKGVLNDLPSPPTLLTPINMEKALSCSLVRRSLQVRNCFLWSFKGVRIFLLTFRPSNQLCKYSRRGASWSLTGLGFRRSVRSASCQVSG